MNIDKAFAILIGFEGGLSNNAADKGGLTKYGIAKAAHPNIDIANLTQDQAKAIYLSEYWNTSGCVKLKAELQYIHFDTAVNMGIGTAIKLLQKAGGVFVDGVLGDNTVRAATNVSPEGYLLCRLMHYNAIIAGDPSQLVFCKGWTNRVATLFAMSLSGELK